MESKEKSQSNTLPRPPIVVVMGHVDHGKTTLLDYIRKTNVAGKEEGSITQSIGAYEILHPSASSGQARKITFIDTPGHEAFSKMRERGARVADTAILVVAADEGVKPQTKDALECILKEEMQYVVAFTKIDKPTADIERVKSELAKAGVYLEGYGGNVSYHGVSGKTGEGVNELLDLILLAAELEGVTYDPNAKPEGLILTVRTDNKRGVVVGAVLQNGTLSVGQFIGTPSASGKIRILENAHGKNQKTLQPSSPMLILGWKSTPRVGEIFIASSREEDILAYVKPTSEASVKQAVENIIDEEKSEKIKIILKADEMGSLEILEELIEKLSKEINLVVAGKGVGDIYENDIKTADSIGGLVLGFKSGIDKAGENLIRAKKVSVITSPIIYELEKQIREYAKKIVPAKNRTIEVLAVFGSKGKEQIVGGKVLHGIIKNQEPFEIWHNKRKIGDGKIMNLQSGRKDIAEVEEGKEVGLLVETKEPIKVGHLLIFPEETNS